ncbi:hypothetical protein FSARC_3269 [Fusarium sarcochroum]|uniref:F-box domain-containing protein n=1 Tax=Fusarium sarcochroum TaxID=1208366 RepID=A0A8H4XBX5_9HYPO|nr:hypothetical protein FSARC_3269 [Fusarium sarcochroum]
MDYNIDPEQILRTFFRTCTYHRHEFDRVLVRTPDAKLRATFLQTAFENSISSGLGALDRFPQELILLILRELDLVSYLRFRRVNNRARNITTASREYKIVVKYGLEGLKPLLKAEMAHLFTVTHFYQTLVNPKCKFCGKFGPFLSLITCQRCCFTCLQISDDLRVVASPVSTAFSKLVERSKDELEQAFEPKLRVVYGKYSLETWPKVKRPRYLVQKNSVFDTLTSLGVSQEIASKALGGHIWPWEHQRHNDVVHWYCNRYMASTSFPWFDTSRGQVETGVSCKGCQFRVEEYIEANFPRDEPPWGFNDRDRVYTREEYVSHFRSCEHAKEVWNNSQGGTEPRESDFTRNGGVDID